MGIVSSAKGEFLKVFLEKLTHGDTGSTILGAIAAAVVAVPNLSDLFSSDQTKQMHEAALVAGALVISVWGYFIGKKKKT